MAEPRQKPLYIGLHIHKCAGTSLQIHLAQSDTNGTWFWHTNPIVNYRQSKPEVEERNLVARQDVRVIWGHQVQDYFLQFFVERPIFLFTFLRDPVKRMVSWYKYDARRYLEINGNLDGFDSFNEYAAKRKNQICHFILKRFPNLVNNDFSELHDRTISVLEQFAFIGLQEDFQAGANRLMKFMKVPILPEDLRRNVDAGEIYLDYSPDQIADLNSSDIKLYKYVKSRYQASPIPDPSKKINPVKLGFSEKTDDLRRFLSLRVKTFTDDIVANHKQDEYSVDNVRKIIYLMLRQCFVETNPDRLMFYKKMLLQWVDRFEIDLEESEILKIGLIPEIKSVGDEI
jgi:Sulfotransferase family